MDNFFTLTAQIIECHPLRYSPAGIPILDMVLMHQSWQLENEQQCLVKFHIPAKIIGKDAANWQYCKQAVVKVSGFLAQQGRNYPKLILRIQNIQNI